ncbi:MAG: septum site-determining protein MinC [Firmicutes bacterium]|nr:septum site-determining protein MinC [Bacillota bacterium]
MGQPVNIKGTRSGLVILFDSEADYDEVKDYLHKKMSSAKGFFKGAKFTIENNNTIPDNKKSEIEEICSQYGLVRTDEKIELPNLASRSNNDSTSQRGGRDSKTPPGEQTLLIRRTLRSGHSIKYDGNVVIMGDVHAGAEIIAGGNVMVLGRLSGVVHAGASGDQDAKVVASKLCPTQLRIGSAIVTSPDDEPPHPEVARLQKDQITVEKYIPTKI